MYSIAHIEGSFNGIRFADMTNGDFENYIIIYKAIRRLEGVKTLKKIALNSSLDILNYVKKITANLNNKLEISHIEIHDTALEYVIRAILLNQTFIENVKVYSKTLNKEQKEKVNSWINKNERLQFLRILRNYTYHNTIPVETSVMSWDMLAEKYKDIEVILDSKNLINNIKETGRDIKFIGILERMLDEETNLINYFEGWIKESNYLFDMIVGCLAENLKKYINIFNEKFYNVFISTNGDVIDMHRDGTYDKYIIDKEMYKKVVQKTKIEE